MPNEQLGLLQLQQNTSQQAIGAIASNTQSYAQRGMDATQLQIGVAQSAANFIETKRVRDAQLEDSKARTAIAYQSMMAEKALMPLRIQNEMLRMKALARQEAMVNISQLTQGQDMSMTSLFAKNKNPQTIIQWDAWKQQWAGHVANGGQFDAAKFQEGYDKIYGHYSDETRFKTTEYDPQTEALLYQKFGEKSSIAIEYSQNNPAIKPALQEVRARILTASSQDLDEAIAAGFRYTTPEQQQRIMLDRVRLQGVNDKIEMLNRVAYGLQAQITSGGLQEGEDQVLQTRYSQTVEDIGRLERERDNIITGGTVETDATKREYKRKYSIFPGTLEGMSPEAQEDLTLRGLRLTGKVTGPSRSMLDPSGPTPSESLDKTAEKLYINPERSGDSKYEGLKKSSQGLKDVTKIMEDVVGNIKSYDYLLEIAKAKPKEFGILHSDAWGVDNEGKTKDHKRSIYEDIKPAVFMQVVANNWQLPMSHEKFELLLKAINKPYEFTFDPTGEGKYAVSAFKYDPSKEGQNISEKLAQYLDAVNYSDAEAYATLLSDVLATLAMQAARGEVNGDAINNFLPKPVKEEAK